MYKKQIWRYYCDYCKHARCRSVENHEQHCTNNPNRTCRMCKFANLRTKLVVEAAKIAAEVTATNSIELLERLKRFVGGCPACILAAIRQCGNPEATYFFNYDYEDEVRQWWNKLAEDSMRAEVYQ